MNHREKSQIVNRILSGYTRCKVGGKMYLIKAPSYDVQYLSDEVYRQARRECRFEEWIDNPRLLKLLIFLGLWEFDGEAKYKTLEKTIEDLKVKLYESVLGAPAAHDKVRKTLNACKLKQRKMYGIRHCLDHITYDGYAEAVSQRFVYARTICSEDKQQVWPDIDDVDGGLLERIIIVHKMSELDTTGYREVARSEPWRSIWSLHKDFLTATVDITNEARSIMLFSRMYDNAAESPECPKEDLVKDDDIFDGWLLTQKREREQAQMDKELEHSKERVFGKSSRTKDASEFFLPAENREEAKRIQDVNDLEAQMIRKQRDAKLIQAGDQEVNVLDLPDVRRELTMKSNQQFIQTVKGNRK